MRDLKILNVMTKIFLLLMLTLYTSITLFDVKAEYGGTCAPRQNTMILDDALSNLSSSTIYKFVLSLIDIENCGNNFNGGCFETNYDSMNVCVKTLDTLDDEATITNSRQYKFNVGELYRLGDMTSHPLVIGDDNLSNIVLAAGLIDSKLCIVMPTHFGYAPLACRNTRINNLSDSIRDYSKCNVSQSCNLNGSGFNPSKTKNNTFGIAMKCFLDSMDMVFFDPATCSQNNVTIAEQIEATSKVSLTPFVDFFNIMKNIVFAAITLYVIIIGMNMALNPHEFNAGSLFIAVLKIILVLFFSIGLNSNNWMTGKTHNENGITSLVLPMAIKFSQEMSSYFLNNSNDNNLCYFDSGDYDDPNYSYFSIWDSFDCRMNVYTGLSPVLFQNAVRDTLRRIDISGEIPSSAPNSDFRSKDMHYALTSSDKFVENQNIGVVGNSYPQGIPIIIVMASLILGGSGIIAWIGPVVLVLLMLVLCVITLTSSVASMVFIYILAYVAPIFVPMALFERTKTFFEKWMYLVISCALYPVIYIAISAFCVSMIDQLMFEDCVFKKYEHDEQYIFALMVPDNEEGRRSCKSSMGYTLMHYYQTNYGWRNVDLLLFNTYVNVDPGNLLTKSLRGLIVCFFLGYFITKIDEIASSISQSIGTGAVTSSPVDIYNDISKSVAGLADSAVKGFKGS